MYMQDCVIQVILILIFLKGGGGVKLTNVFIIIGNEMRRDKRYGQEKKVQERSGGEYVVS